VRGSSDRSKRRPSERNLIAPSLNRSRVQRVRAVIQVTARVSRTAVRKRRTTKGSRCREERSSVDRGKFPRKTRRIAGSAAVPLSPAEWLDFRARSRALDASDSRHIARRSARRAGERSESTFSRRRKRILIHACVVNFREGDQSHESSRAAGNITSPKESKGKKQCPLPSVLSILGEREE